jgi:transcriptional regulator with XRE-family HTH domain
MRETPTLGKIIKRIRQERGWTLADMSSAVSIPLSTLSKIENDKLTLTYDKLQQLSYALNIPLSELFAQPRRADAPGMVTARRSIATIESAVRVETPNYEYFYLCGDLHRRRMIPIYARVTARNLAEFGEMVRHSGEEFAFVISGAVDLHTEFYTTARLQTGQGVYIDSNMGHAYVLAPGHDDAVILCVCSSSEEQLERELIAAAESQAAPHP